MPSSSVFFMSLIPNVMQERVIALHGCPISTFLIHLFPSGERHVALLHIVVTELLILIAMNELRGFTSRSLLVLI